MIILKCTECSDDVNLKTHIRNNGDMITECLGCGEIRNFKCLSFVKEGEAAQ